MEYKENMTISEVAEALRERGHTGHSGMMGNDSIVKKGLLNQAATYLEDYMAFLEDYEM